MMLIETSLPVRWYLPREDARMDLLTPSANHTVCAYKGVASYLSADGAADAALRDCLAHPHVAVLARVGGAVHLYR